VPPRPHSAGAAIRLLTALALALAAVMVLPAAAAPGDTGRGTSSGFGAMLDGGTAASAVAGSDARPTRSASASGLHGAVGAVGQVGVELGAGGTGPDGIAEATATASNVLLLGGRVAVGSLSVSVEAKAGPKGTHAGLSGYSASGLIVDGQAIAATPGRQIDIAGVGTLVLFEQVTDAAGSAQANGLRLQISDPASGLPAGTTVVIGHVEARAEAGEPPAPATATAPAQPATTAPSTTAPATTAPATTAPAAPATTSPGSPTAPAAPAAPARPAPPPRTVQVPPLPAPTPIPSAPTRSTPSLAPLPRPLALPTRPAPEDLLSTSSEGYVFPVYGNVSFTDDYGAPRADADWHHGNDIFAPEGTPILAVADGTLSKVGINRLGGNRLWLTDRRGNSFYYAHLSAFAPAAVDGAQVRAGQVIGFVGHTGDAETTPPHLHFEVHPGDRDSVDPYPYLIAWQRKTQVPKAFEAATVAVGQAPAAGAILVAQTPARDVPPEDDSGLAVVAP
jgi:murein DD-endopeptidase MepM/ murein hydrolase activator NlpD